MKIEIRTADTAWLARHHAGIVEVAKVERLTFAGADMVRFVLADVPRDWANRHAMVPAAHVVSA